MPQLILHHPRNRSRAAAVNNKLLQRMRTNRKWTIAVDDLAVSVSRARRWFAFCVPEPEGFNIFFLKSGQKYLNNKVRNLEIRKFR